MRAEDGALRGRRGVLVRVSWCGMGRRSEYGRGARRRTASWLWWWVVEWREGGRQARLVVSWPHGQSEYRRIRIEGRCRRVREREMSGGMSGVGD
jgi:hypothetical protein